MPDKKTPSTYLTAKHLRDRYNVSHMTIWRWRKDPRLGFPAPIRIGPRKFWRLADLEAWESGRPVVREAEGAE